MKASHIGPSRREWLELTGLSALALLLHPAEARAAGAGMAQRAIPKSGQKLSVIGMGSSRTFDTDLDPESVRQLSAVLRVFFAKGGEVIDTSPMYGAAETNLGKTLARVSDKQGLFMATKVWTYGKQPGIDQMRRSRQRLGVGNIDLMQIHNLRDWKTHLPTLRAMKDQGKIRYIGVTTSHGRYHGELQKLLESEPFDFVQLSYNIENRAVERDLLPLARERGIATLVNRPFQRGALFRKVRGKPLPEWASEFDCQSWAQFFLKSIVGHPAVTCVIPATSDPKHMADNMGAGFGRMPSEGMRRKMMQYVASL